MDARLPACVYASVVLWNLLDQRIDRRVHTSTLNHHEMVVRADGSVRIVVAHADPGVPNWLDAGGPRIGVDILALPARE